MYKPSLSLLHSSLSVFCEFHEDTVSTEQYQRTRRRQRATIGGRGRATTLQTWLDNVRRSGALEG